MTARTYPILGLVSLTLLFAAPSLSQSAPAIPSAPLAANPMAAQLAAMMNAPLRVMPLGGGAYWVSGGVSNTAFVIGDAGVVAIDPQAFPQAALREVADIAKLTAKPINVMILTHSDPDHVNGLPGWPRGMEIIAQTNTARRVAGVAADPRIDDRSFPPPPGIGNYLPTHTVESSEKMVLDGVPMVLMHVAPAHTDGDLVTYLPGQKIVFAGDILTPEVGPYPGLHPNKNGSAVGWMETVRAILALDSDTYISGHGVRLNKAEVRSRLAAAESRYTEVETLFHQGKSLDQIKTTLHDVSTMPGESARFPTYVEAVYIELSGTKQTIGSAPDVNR